MDQENAVKTDKYATSPKDAAVDEIDALEAKLKEGKRQTGDNESVEPPTRALKSKGKVKVAMVNGPSGSGKSTIANGVAGMVGSSVVVIHQDNYFSSKFTPHQLVVDDVNERPSHIDFARLRKDVENRCLERGGVNIVIVEGHMLVTDPQLVAMCDVVLCLDLERDVARQRRIARRERTPEEADEIRHYYNNFVWPAHEKYALPELQKLAQACMDAEEAPPRLRILAADAEKKIMTKEAFRIIVTPKGKEVDIDHEIILENFNAR